MGWYRAYVEPESYAGETELMLQSARGAAGQRAVLVMGDSRIGEGFSARLANELAGHSGVEFINASVPASTPRCWYYLLRELDPDGARYRAIVLPVDDYEDEDGVWDWADRTLDLRILTFCLRLGDAWSITSSVRQAGARWETLRDVVLRGFLLKEDLRDFLSRPGERLRKVEQFRKFHSEWTYNYAGNPNDLQGLAVDWQRGAVAFPARLSPAQKDELQAALLRKTEPQFGMLARYRRLWFGRMLEKYRGSATRLIVLRLPRGPAPRPHPRVPFPHVLQDMHASNLMLLPEHSFEALETPDFFFDSLHLNARGRAEFSTALATSVLAAIQ